MSTKQKRLESRVIAKRDQMWMALEDHFDSLERIRNGICETPLDNAVAQTAAKLVYTEIQCRRLHRLRQGSGEETLRDIQRSPDHDDDIVL